jgi:tetratricopeptide (TPR) repeat protein/TolB-like protein
VQNKAQDDDLVMSLVEMALARAADKRASYLEDACAHDSQLFEEVRKYVEWEERMKGFLLEPLVLPVSERGFEPGELLDGRFRVVREVAQGGMGIVYEAVDERLDRRIAIKCAKTGFRKRLPPEVRHASEIAHPNVCRIFEIHTVSTEHGEIDFLTMEFLEGETLAERLRRGPLPENEARTIAQQLCSGLAAAHRNGVIHGDLKSNNVILATGADGAIRAVITDFGLARGSEATQRTVQSGVLGGTPDYMAPELWKGEKATVASDIYALGVILYELASGGKPYPSAPELPWEERLTRKAPAANPKWDRVLARCLDPDPALRYPNADEIGQALAPRSRRWMLAAAAAVLLAVASGVVTYERATGPKETVRLAVLPFEADTATAPLAEGLLRDTAAQLAGLRSSSRTNFRLIPLSNLQRRDVETTEKAQAILGATHVLHGTLRKEGEKLKLHVQLTNASSRVDAKQWDAEYPAGEVRYIPIALAGIVTETLRLPLLATPATVNGGAIQDYMKGIAAVRRDTGIDDAIVFFQRTIAADPDSPLTHAALAEAQWFKYNATKDQVWLDRATESEKQAERRNPDLAAVHRIRGLLIYHSGGYDEAVKEYHRAIELEPYNSDAYRRLGLAYEANNQLDEALAAYRRAVEAEPAYYRNHQDLGAYYLERSNYAEAAKHYGKAVELAPGEPNLRFVLGVVYLDLGRYVDAENNLRSAIALKPIPTALNTLGVTLMYEERDRDAIPYFLQALMLAPGRYLSWMNLGICYRRIGLSSESLQADKSGLEAAETEMGRNSRNGYVRSILAYLAAALGDRRRAESDIEQALQLSPNNADVRFVAVETYEALGRRDAALAVASGAPPGTLADLSRWPDLADLHKDARFQELLASHKIK